MTLTRNARRQFTLCRCGQAFQGENFKKHRQSAKDKAAHTNEKRVLYCVTCNKFEAGHGDCPLVRLSKANMLLVLNHKEPLDRLRLIADARVEKENRELLEPLPVWKQEEAMITEKLSLKRLDDGQAELDAVATIQGGDKSRLNEILLPCKREKRTSEVSASPTSSEKAQPCGSSSLTKVEVNRRGILEQVSCYPNDETAPVSSKVALTNLVERCESPEKLSVETWNKTANCFAVSLVKRAERCVVKQKRHVMDLERQLAEAKESIEKGVSERDMLRLQLNEAKVKEAKAENERKLEQREKEKAIAALKIAYDKMKTMSERIVGEQSLAKVSRPSMKRSLLGHIACRNGKIVARHWEEDGNLESTTKCYVNSATGTHCHHVTILSSDAVEVEVRNSAVVDP